MSIGKKAKLFGRDVLLSLVRIMVEGRGRETAKLGKMWKMDDAMEGLGSGVGRCRLSRC